MKKDWNKYYVTIAKEEQVKDSFVYVAETFDAEIDQIAN